MSEVRHQKSERYVRTGTVAMESGAICAVIGSLPLAVLTQRALPVRVDATLITHHSLLITFIPAKCQQNVFAIQTRNYQFIAVRKIAVLGGVVRHVSFRAGDPKRIRKLNPAARSQRNLGHHAGRDLDGYLAFNKSIADPEAASAARRSRRVPRIPRANYRESVFGYEFDWI